MFKINAYPISPIPAQKSVLRIPAKAKVVSCGYNKDTDSIILYTECNYTPDIKYTDRTFTVLTVDDTSINDSKEDYQFLGMPELGFLVYEIRYFS